MISGRFSEVQPMTAFSLPSVYVMTESNNLRAKQLEMAILREIEEAIKAGLNVENIEVDKKGVIINVKVNQNGVGGV